jgi:simple sugar transport system ATP-binding protein
LSQASQDIRAADPPVIELEGVTKRFPGVTANDCVSLAIRPGEVHVLLGENGAGKSTLIGMLSGLLQPDEGRIRVDGKAAAIRSPRHALALGIGTVFQHAMLVPTLTVAENLLLGGGPWWRRPRKEALRAEVEALARSLGMKIDLDAVAAELSLGEQQQVEILRALLRKSRVLILDESTSMLTPAGIEELGALMRRLVGHGLAIVFITHKLREAARFGDRISVLKLGRKIGEVTPERFRALDEDTLIADVVEMMFGKRSGDPEEAAGLSHLDLSERGRGNTPTPTPSPQGGGKSLRLEADATESGFVSGGDAAESPSPLWGGVRGGGLPSTAIVLHAAAGARPLLSVRDLTLAPGATSPGLRSISFDLHAGELFGIAGIDGNGQKQLAEVLAGQVRADGGTILLDRVPLDGLDVGARRDAGLRYLSDDRLGEATVAGFPVSLNLLLKQIGRPPYWRGGFEQPGEIARHAVETIRDYDVRTPSPRTPIGRLSGGNIQKVVLARELAEGAKVVIFNKPTYGLDLANTLATRARIREIAARGSGVLLISTDLEELLQLCDRIGVLGAGARAGTVENGPGARAEVGRLMVGLAA